MSINTMKAVRFHEFGDPQVLHYEDAPKPEVGPGEVLIRVHAVGINPPDWYLREGYAALPPEWRPAVPFPAIPGSDVSGVIEALADDVEGFAVGDAVYGMIRFPSFGDSRAYAEYVSAPASDVALKPAGIDHVHAAAVPMSGLTAWQFLIDLGHDVDNPLQPTRHEPVPLAGKRVLVNGAAGVHQDHSGNIGLFPKATFLVAASELAWARGTPTPFGVEAASVALLGKVRVEPLDEDKDVFGDGSIKIIKAPGHTPGGRSLFVRLAKAGSLLVTGDLYHTRENYEKGLVPSPNVDRAQTLASFDRFKRIAANTKARVIVQHAPEDFAALPAFPKYLD